MTLKIDGQDLLVSINVSADEVPEQITLPLNLWSLSGTHIATQPLPATWELPIPIVFFLFFFCLTPNFHFNTKNFNFFLIFL